MAAFYGGRAEIHERRELVAVTYVDLESTYPTLFTIQNLSRFLRAREIRTEDVTEQVKTFVRDATPEGLMRSKRWGRLQVIVELEADDDVLPVRTAYGRARLQLTRADRSKLGAVDGDVTRRGRSASTAYRLRP